MLSPTSLLILSLICLIPIGVYSQAEPDTLGHVVSGSIVDSLEADMAPAPATNVTVADTDNDAGGSITISWDASPDDYEGGKVRLYRILRAEAVDGQPGEFTEVGDSPAGKADYSTDDGNTSDDVFYFYKVVTVNVVYNEAGEESEFTSESDMAGPITSSQQWFHKQRINTLVGMVLLSFFIIFYIVQAKAGKKLFIRKIAGLEAV
ncbi:MAG: fibronectin type III domain-containing protein, partial [Desulfobacteraceae bacterium]|nr:fibronectin type III domain-containing protein [Desulfobacteraceae bacterium]